MTLPYRLVPVEVTTGYWDRRSGRLLHKPISTEREVRRQADATWLRVLVPSGSGERFLGHIDPNRSGPVAAYLPGRRTGVVHRSRDKALEALGAWL